MIREVINLVRNASQLMDRKDVAIKQKGNASNYVTSADVDIQQYLRENLLKLLPGSGFIGEEEEGSAYTGGDVWVVDPIDGTSNFIRDIGLSAISVGLVREGKPYLGVVYQPYRDEMYWAEIGKGAFMNEMPIHVSDRDFSHSHLCSAMSLYDKNYAGQCFEIIKRVYSESDDLRRLGSAVVELAYLAAGRVELYFEIRVFPWDVAGAIPIIKEAGGQVDILFEQGMPLDRPFPFIAANTPENLNYLKKIVYEEMPQKPY